MTDASTCSEPTKPLLYLSGPMTGLPDFNYPAFDEAAARLRALGYPVFNPTETFGGCQTLPKETYMMVDLAAVRVANVVVALPGWIDSEGALREIELAQELGIGVITYETALARCEAGEVIRG